MTVLLVAFGAAFGAVLRYLTDRWAQRRFGQHVPVGTFMVNVAGSLILGLLAGAAVSAPAMALLGTGFCGALTTYSTFGYETVRLAEQGFRGRALGYAMGSVGAGLLAAVAGLLAGSAL